MDAVAEALREGDHSQHGQAELRRDVATRQQDRPAPLRFDEAASSPVVGPRVATLVDTAGSHRCRVSRGRHVTEADDALDTQIIEPAGDGEQRLAQADLVRPLLHRYGGGGARGDRVDHRAVAADVGLHHMGRDDVG